MKSCADRLRSLFVFIIFGLCSSCAHGLPTSSDLKGIDTFGSSRVSSAQIKNEYGSKVERLAHELNQRRFEEAQQIQAILVADIKSEFHLAYVNITMTSYYAPRPGQYATVDVVEPADVPTRMNFLPKPKGHFPDPEDLIDLWKQYFQKGMDLLSSGQLTIPQTCPAWHCIYGFEDSRLAPFLNKFNSLVPKHKKELERILRKDARPEFRGDAAFLLAHLKNAKVVIRDMLTVTRDPAPVVRNNAVRVLGYIALKHPEMKIPIRPILQVLNFPDATDRNKAAFVLSFLSLKKENAKEIIRSSGRILLGMLKLQQPNNHDPAYAILKNLSGQSFGDRDYDSWNHWLREHGMMGATN